MWLWSLVKMKESNVKHLSYFTELSGGESQLIFPVEKPDKSETKLYMKQFTLDVCDNMGVTISFWPFGKLESLYKHNHFIF